MMSGKEKTINVLEDLLNGYQVLTRKIGAKGRVSIAESSDKTGSELAGLNAKLVVLDIFKSENEGEEN